MHQRQKKILDMLRYLRKRDLISDRAEAKQEVREFEKEQRKEDIAAMRELKEKELTAQVNDLFEAKEKPTVDKRWVQMHRQIYPKLYQLLEMDDKAKITKYLAGDVNTLRKDKKSGTMIDLNVPLEKSFSFYFFAAASAAIIRKSVRLIFPLVVFGRDSTNSIRRGYLYGAVCVLTYS